MTSIFGDGRFGLRVEEDDRLDWMSDHLKRLALIRYSYARRCYEGAGEGDLESFARAMLKVEMEPAMDLALGAFSPSTRRS